MRGRKPKPAHIHLINGNPSRTNPKELEAQILFDNSFSDEIPEPAETLTGEALAEWNRLVPELQKAKIFKSVDKIALTQFCIMYERWVTAEKHLKEKGLWYKTNKGVIALNPNFKIVTHCIEQMRSIMSDFGMSPAARVRIKGALDGSIKKDDPFDLFMKNEKKQA